MALKYAINDVDILDNCVSWLPLNEYSAGSGVVTRYDAHGSNDLTDNNTTASAAGNWNRGADFEFSNSESLSRSAQTWGISNAFSYSFWVKTETTTNNGRVFMMGTANGANQVYALINSSNKFNIQIRDSAGSLVKDYTSTTSVSASTWTHLVFTWDGTSLLGYINGAAETFTKNNDNSGTLTDSSREFRIGATSTPNAYFDGVIQDFSIYSVALTSTQVSRLYNSGDGMTYGVDFDMSTQNSTTASSQTTSHTCTGTNRLLLVGVGSNTTSLSESSITGVTYAGVSMTKIAYIKHSSANNYVWLYALENPTSGANNVIVSASGSQKIEVGITSLVGAKQTVTLDSYASTQTASTTPTYTTTTVADYCQLLLTSWLERAPTAGTNTLNISGSGINQNNFRSINAIDTAGSSSLTWTQSDSTRSTGIIASIAPYAEATSSISAITGVAIASVSSRNGVAIASVSNVSGVANS